MNRLTKKRKELLIKNAYLCKVPLPYVLESYFDLDKELCVGDILHHDYANDIIQACKKYTHLRDIQPNILAYWEAKKFLKKIGLNIDMRFKAWPQIKKEISDDLVQKKANRKGFVTCLSEKIPLSKVQRIHIQNTRQSDNPYKVLIEGVGMSYEYTNCKTLKEAECVAQQINNMTAG
jgi:hypothetical protein